VQQQNQQQQQQQQQQQLLGSESIHASNGNGSIQNTNGGVEQEDSNTSCYSGQGIIDIDGMPLMLPIGQPYRLTSGK